MRPIALFVCAALALTIGAVPSPTPAPTPGAIPTAAPTPVPAVVVHIKNFAFVPNSVEIHAGQSVEWINDDEQEHSATAVDGSWNSGELDQGKSWTYTFSAPGTYEYYCDDHDFMKGVVNVD